MAYLGSRRGEANLGLPLMLLTFLMLGGFMYWLYVTAEPTAPAVAEVMEEPEDDYLGTTVTPEDLKTGVDSYVGQEIRLRGVNVSQLLGAQAFFVDLPASEALPATPFLVRMSGDLAAGGMSVAMADETTLIGTLHTMSDSVVSDWSESGTLGDNDRLLVEFATHFIEANEIEITGGAEEAPAGS